ncbi:hypothetical protein LIA77_09450 [Sarocladium implicatum]|nr:hypothetical protein LIA77_09450 [Sarocladium implicatum]
MLSFAPAPIFGASMPAWDSRPAISSPLSSSPVRATSPLSPLDKNALFQRQTQSSPIQPPKFSKFASRQTRPNPLVRKREDAQEARRTNFLQSVRRKAEDKAWQRRDIEGYYLKNSWLADKAQLSRDAPIISDADIEDAMEFGNEQPQPPADDDDMMEDDVPGDEDIEAMLASYEQDAHTSQRPRSPSFSDDEYDDIFADLMSREQPQHSQSGSQSDAADAMYLSQEMVF